MSSRKAPYETIRFEWCVPADQPVLLEMAMDQNEAIEIAQRALDNKPVVGNRRLSLFGPAVETDRAWVFRYQSARWVETEAREDMLIGAGPLYVDKRAGEVWFLGTYAPADVVIRELERRLDEQQRVG